MGTKSTASIWTKINIVQQLNWQLWSSWMRKSVILTCKFQIPYIINVLFTVALQATYVQIFWKNKGVSVKMLAGVEVKIHAFLT